MRRAAALAAAVASAIAAAPAAAAPVTEVAGSGQVLAALSYDQSRQGYSGLRVTVARAGRVLVGQALPTGCGADPCPVAPAHRAAGRRSVNVRDLDRDGEPEAIVDLFTGGAHCCTVSFIWSFDAATGGYRRLRHNWLDAGYRLVDLGRDRSLELRSRDARFAYAFSSYAESYLPVRVLRFRRGKLADVSRRFPRLLRADARSALRLYRRHRGGRINVRGMLAAYAADRYRLGSRRAARRTLFRALRRGDLGPAFAFDTGPFGRAYIGRLDRFLRRLGYARR
jgi:hypothetical protein